MKISKIAIKRFVKAKFGMVIDDAAAEEMATILEGKAAAIAKYAVEHSKKNPGKKKAVCADDVYAYKLKFGD